MPGSRVSLGVVLATLALVLAGCGGGDRLAELRTDPMATVSPQGAGPAQVTEWEGSSGALGKPSPARLNRRFKVSPEDVHGVVGQLADAARAAGWELSARPLNSYYGERMLDGETAQLTIQSLDSGEVWIEIYSRR